MTTPLHAADHHDWDEVFVLREYELREGFTLADTARFRDEVWSLSPAAHQMHMRSFILRFAAIPDRYRSLAKELFCTYMAIPLPAGEERLGLATLRSEFVEIRRFLQWLHDHRGAPRLADLTGQDLLDYVTHLRAEFRNMASAARSRAAVSRIWRFRRALPGDYLPFDPQHIDGWPRYDQHRRGENRTDRLPEQVMGPLIVWATRFVDLFAADILAMTTEWAQLRRNHASIPKTHGQRRPDLLPALEKLLARHLEDNRPLPGRKGRINYSFLAKVLTASRSSLDRVPAYTQRIAKVAEVVGLDEETYFYTPVRGQLDGRPWLERISNECGDHSLPVLSRLLQIACYILIAFYSGMRDSEVKHLNRGCLHVERDTDGYAYRWKVHARAFKGERDRKGVPAVWVVGEPAARAIHVLEALQPADTTILFQVVPYGVGWTDEHTGRALTNTATNDWLKRFTRCVNDYCATHHRARVLALVDVVQVVRAPRCGRRRTAGSGPSRGVRGRGRRGRVRGGSSDGVLREPACRPTFPLSPWPAAAARPPRYPHQVPPRPHPPRLPRGRRPHRGVCGTTIHARPST